MATIYKISSPTGKIYIGQTKDWKTRQRYYQNLNCKGQIKLYRSFLKHGVENHVFEVIEKCSIKQLNTRERHWQEFYDCIENGLNCVLQSSEDKPKVVSLETRQKISKSRKGKLKGGDNPMYGTISPFAGKSHSEQTLKVLREKKLSGNNPRAKKVIDTETGIVYDSAAEAGRILSIPKSRLGAYLRGHLPNKTSLKYC